MALYATNRFAGDGVTTQYEINFAGKYLDRRHVKAYQEDNTTRLRTELVLTPSNFLNDTTLTGLPVTPVGHTLVIHRVTPARPLVDFVDGARVTSVSLDTATRQGLFIAAEALDAVSYENLGDLPEQLQDLQKAWAESIAAAEQTAVAKAQVSALAAQVATAAGQVATAAGQVAADRADVVTAHAEVMPAWVATMSAAAGALADRVRAETAANWADVRATQATANQAAAESAATAAASSAAQADALAASLVGGATGFDASAYDWGWITDPMTYFNQDWGTLP